MLEYVYTLCLVTLFTRSPQQMRSFSQTPLVRNICRFHTQKSCLMRIHYTLKNEFSALCGVILLLLYKMYNLPKYNICSSCKIDIFPSNGILDNDWLFIQLEQSPYHTMICCCFIVHQQVQFYCRINNFDLLAVMSLVPGQADHQKIYYSARLVCNKCVQSFNQV